MFVPKNNFDEFRPMVFSVEVAFTTNAAAVVPDGAKAEGSVAINDYPFIFDLVTHQIVQPTNLNNSVQIEQNGLYRIDWSLYNQERFFQGTPPMADAYFGSVRHGIWNKLKSPLALEKNKTINVELLNVQEKTREYTVQVLFHGVEDRRTEEQKQRDRELYARFTAQQAI